MSIMTLDEAVRQGIITADNDMYEDEPKVQGDYLDYEPEHKTCVLREEQTGWEKDQTFKTEKLGWRLGRTSDDQLILVADDATKAKLRLRGKLGDENGEEAIDEMCKKLYSNSKLGCFAISITDDEMLDEGSVPRPITPNKLHWVRSSLDNFIGGIGINWTDDEDSWRGWRACSFWYLSKVNEDNKVNAPHSVRPVVPLDPDIPVEILDSCDGSKEKPWHIVLPDEFAHQGSSSAFGMSELEFKHRFTSVEKQLEQLEEVERRLKWYERQFEEQRKFNLELVEKLNRIGAKVTTPRLVPSPPPKDPGYYAAPEKWQGRRGWPYPYFKK